MRSVEIGTGPMPVAPMYWNAGGTAPLVPW